MKEHLPMLVKNSSNESCFLDFWSLVKSYLIQVFMSLQLLLLISVVLCVYYSLI